MIFNAIALNTQATCIYGIKMSIKSINKKVHQDRHSTASRRRPYIAVVRKVQMHS